MKKFLFSFFNLVFLTSLFVSCHFFYSMENGGGDTTDYDKEIKAVTFKNNTLNVNTRESEYLKLTLNPAANQGKCSVSWEYDSSFIDAKTDNFGAVITGKKAGSTFIKAKCNGIVATCLISVIARGDDVYGNPYIYSNYSVVQLKPNDAAAISASLYGGSIADMENFTWSIKDPSVADISFSRNNCIVTAKKTGSTQLIATHPDAQYPYSFVIYVYTDKLTEPYITTDYNVFSVNKNETSYKTIKVDLVNPLSSTYKNGFKWDFADEKSKEIIDLNANLDTAEILPLKNGVANIVVTHENAQYPLNITVRVSTIVENAYIALSSSTVLLNDSETPVTVNATVENVSKFVNNEDFIWTVPEESLTLAECTPSGNTIRIQGKKNGTFKINVSHPLSEYSRNVLVILQNQIGSAIDSSMYITTDQNYIQTQVGKDAATVNVRLVGGIDGQDNIGDENQNFTWFIKGGRDNGIVEVQNVTGYVKDRSSRSAVASGNSAPGKLSIKPLKEGEVTIVVSHSRCLYDTEITVKVYSESALVNPKTISTQDSLIKLLNGTSKEITAILRNHNAADENLVKWSSANASKISVSPAEGRTTVISACGTGSAQTYVSAHLDGALSDKKILVLSADTQNDLDNMKGIFSDSTFLRISVDETKKLSVEQFGLASYDRVSWTSSNNSICSVNGDSSSPYCTSANVNAHSEGSAVIKASIGASLPPVEFNVTVLKKGKSSEIYDENASYLTTNLNAVVIKKTGQSALLNVNGVNISASDMALHTKWTLTDVNSVQGESVFDLAGSPGSTVTLTANKPGKSNIRVTNKMSMNSLSINAKCGELYEWNDNYIVYIKAENDVVNVMNGQSVTIGCSLVNTSQFGSFSWKVTQGKDNIEITGLTSGTCRISGVQPGQSIITVSNSLAGEVTKEILVNVANTEEELKGFKYLTTTQNVVTVGEQNNVSVNVDIKNADSNIISGYSWRSSDTTVATVVGSGSVAVIYGKKIGSTKIIVENYENCSYPLEIIVNVIDPVAASLDPYITCNNIVTCNVGDGAQTVAAQLVGGLASDTTGFSWTIADKTIAKLNASNDSAQITALKEGVTQVIVSHPKASVSRSILVICEPKVVTNCYISLTESIIKMKPSDSPRTITATLVNGKAEDVYDFKWWADSYDKININYTGESCVIEPISSGTVTIHCSHPKAASVKDIILYISNYTDFAFASKSVEVVTGTDMFINMEVPATGVDCDVAYSSSDNSLCTVFGNNLVCTLHPGKVPQGVTAKSCVITATLQTKGGVKQAQAQLLVSVTKKDETKPYIGMFPDSSSTIITMNKDEIRNISAKLYGTTIDTTSSGLKWYINEGQGKTVEFTSKLLDNSSLKSYGADVQIKAVNSGKTTITVEHSSENGISINPLTIYVVVTGVNEPTVNLNFEKLPIVIGEDTQTLVATVNNDRGEELEWKVVNDLKPDEEQTYFNFTSKGNKASITALKPGSATVYCKIPSNGSTASCKVIITQAPKISFFVYDDESNFTYNNGILTDKRTKYYIKSLQVFPGQTKPLHWETVPAKDKITSWYKGDSSYFDVNQIEAGYLKSWKDPASNKVFYYPDGIGTVAITGKTSEGTSVVQATTASLQTSSLSITNSYGYLFSVDKTIVSSTPKKVHDKPELLYINYELRPACGKLIVTNLTHGSAGSNLNLKNGKKLSDKVWEITQHSLSGDSASTGIVKGILQFEVNGEVNCNVQIKAVNENVISSGAGTSATQTVGQQSIKVKVYYPSHKFIPTITRSVPYVNHDLTVGPYSNNSIYAKYSGYDSATNTIFLGDGEYLSGIVKIDETNEPYSNVNINKVFFEEKKSTLKDGFNKVQSELVAGQIAGSSFNSHDFILYHTHDYAVYSYKTSGTSLWTDVSDGLKNMYRLHIENEKYLEVRNETIKETSYVGNLVVEYTDYTSGSGYSHFNIPVYVKVRNCPCAEPSDYFKAYTK
ncbi:hypothetical protein [Treponema pectinovorum]|uniref:hypothetical protein n=1 Tax=Treponema pectinovorum TaxID=164 RepID=UPI0011F30ACA|nr:hypothetical protein [Treponema pectinovorum]